MKFIPFQIISVFTEKQRKIQGNPAACLLLDGPRKEEDYLRIAREFNMPATSFIWEGEKDQEYNIRWFAPDGEIDLCGHGSAAAAVYLGKRFDTHQPIRLRYPRGEVSVVWEEDDTFSIVLDPIFIKNEVEIPEAIKSGLGIPLTAMYKTDNKHLILTDKESSLRDMRPDYEVLRQSDIFGYAITAPGDEVDFVSRSLVPHVLQLEDHATGSSHAILTPYWAETLNKDHMRSLQLSPRGGSFNCAILDGKVHLSGKYEVLDQGNISISAD
ncbi:MAG TPA: PhzF family phenazine biosynthesis protein [Cyclobacteriaceae bacterium]|nr:PhzF family phenazine biosynthesis protein [Cyclobacteriaceae bacterium]